MKIVKVPEARKDWPEEWDAIPEEDREALIEWYNISDLNNEDRLRLAQLYHDGNFSYWECPECSDLCMVGDPADWSNFQGVWQSEVIGQLCAACAGRYRRLKAYAEE